VAERKNIFLVGRQGHRGDENQLTEMLAFLWQEHPDVLVTWLGRLGLDLPEQEWEVETQFVLPSRKRPDLVLTSQGLIVIVESKLDSGLGDTQLDDYLEYLELEEHTLLDRHLVVLTKAPTASPRHAERALASGISYVETRWQDMTDAMRDSYGDGLANDFVQLLTREGLVKPPALMDRDWAAWNRGFDVALRVDGFLSELTPIALERYKLDNVSAGSTKRWLYRLWKSPQVQLGLGFGASASDNNANSEPIVFSMCWNAERTKDQAKAAIGGRNWGSVEGLSGSLGLLWGEWPTRAVNVSESFGEASFEEQLEVALTFIDTTAAFFAEAGYLPEQFGAAAHA